uniref:Uncharacterized protein n=1 Tax=Candidatus Kentrum sp. TUN TaxID=2126343 RepID=A0A451A7C6_9GAMM|nr:MAG: hypothetical protein BECKTUN1418F_GA0071002_107614 [Candidatus Kentron sp. TUN]VFK61931.1 MAG: hypothetical protein BECKTUN1418E_GA0071001_107314 [Candidatus Kentron sp. TUN]
MKPDVLEEKDMPVLRAETERGGRSFLVSTHPHGNEKILMPPEIRFPKASYRGLLYADRPFCLHCLCRSR